MHVWICICIPWRGQTLHITAYDTMSRSATGHEWRVDSELQQNVATLFNCCFVCINMNNQSAASSESLMATYQMCHRSVWFSLASSLTCEVPPWPVHVMAQPLGGRRKFRLDMWYRCCAYTHHTDMCDTFTPHTHTHTHTHMHTHILTHSHTCTHTCTRTYTCTHTYTHKHTYTFTYTQMHSHNTHSHTHAHTHAHTHVHTHTLVSYPDPYVRNDDHRLQYDITYRGSGNEVVRNGFLECRWNVHCYIIVVSVTNSNYKRH